MSLFLFSGLSQEAWELLEFVNNKTANYPELAGMFLDEMCISLINTSISDKAFLEKFQGKFASRVEEDYIEDIVEYENENYGIKMTCEMLLDKDVEDSDKPISLFLAPMVSISHGLDSTSSSLIKNKNLSQLARLLPLLRLLHKTVSLSSGGVLDDVDALLGKVIFCKYLIFVRRKEFLCLWYFIYLFLRLWYLDFLLSSS